MKIQLKRSNVLTGGVAKTPTAEQMEYGELAVNYNETDPVIFIKDSTDAIIRLAGAGASGSFDGDYESLTNKPTIGDGTLTLNDANGTALGTFTANQEGTTEVNLPAGFSGDYNDLSNLPTIFSGDYNDLTNQPTIGDGTITIKNSDGSTNASFSVNQTGPTEVTLPAGFSGDYDDLSNLPTIGNGTITIKSGGTNVGTFTVNQTGATEIDIPAASWGDIDEKPIYIDTNTPGSPNNGDLWVDLNECPPELKIWSDCSGTGQWEGIEGTPALTVITPVLSGNPAQGQVLTSTLGQAVGGKAPYTFVYNFQDQNDNVLQATAANTYTLVSADVSKTITVSVTATDSSGTVLTSSKSNTIGPIVPPESVNAPTLLTPANSSTDLSVSSITLTCSAYSGVQSVYASTTWQVSTAADFSSTVYDVTNSNQTSNVATFSPALDYDGTYYARCRHTSSNGIASDYSNVNTFTTEADPVDPNNPNADMSGLRFDKDRGTLLKRQSVNTGNYFTVSFWAKPTTTADEWVWQSKPNPGTASNQFGIYKNTSQQWIFISESAQNAIDTYELNTWAHIVMVSRSSFNVDVYINGELKGTYNRSFIVNDNVFGIGGAVDEGQYNGYLSEYYLVEGEELTATDFGKTFPDGRWGPLDSSIIKENISNSVVQPYDTRANTDQVWSANVTSSDGGFFSGRPKENMFDADTSTMCGTSTQADGVYLDITFPNLTYTKSVEIWTNSTGPVTINDQPSITSVGGKWETIVNGSGTLSTMRVQSNNPSGTAGANAIRVDGRLLVDKGVWDNSQNWSGSSTLTGGTFSKNEASKPWSNAFDGDSTEYGALSSGSVVGDRVVFNTTGLTATRITMYGQVPANAGIGMVVNNRFDNTDGDTGRLQAGGSPFAGEVYIDFGAPTAINQIGWEVIKNGSGPKGAYWIKADGAILVDAGATWDTSQVWSANTTASNIGQNFNGVNNVPSYITNIFDGDTAIGLYPEANTTSTIDLTSLTIPSGTFEVYIGYNGNQSATGATYNGNQTITGLGPAGWYTLPVTPNTIEVNNTSGQWQYGLHAIRVAGKILVDGGSFGDDGFYLPFDPTNTGADYTSAGADDNTSSLGNAFNANTTTFWTTLNDPGTSTYTFAPAISNITSLRIFMGSSIATTNFAINGTAPAGFTGANPDNWYDFTDHVGGTLSSITVAKNSGSYLTSVAAIEVNGEILVDHSTIGVDASGNKNNFHDENFAVGNTSTVWSQYLTASSAFSLNTRREQAFAGTVLYKAMVPNNETMTWSPATLLTGVTSFGVASERNFTVTITWGDNTTKPFALGDSSLGSPSIFYIPKADITAKGGQIKGFTITRTGGAGSPNYTYLYGIVVNGEKLVDTNVQDTVTDTPMMNYAMLREGNNGNLLGSSSTTGVLTYRGEVGVQYYYEADGVGFVVTGLVPSVTGSNGVTYNFGQQPFIDSRVSAYNRVTGVVTFDGTEYKTLFQTWDEWATFGLFVYDANQGKAIRTFELNKTYGLQDVLTAANIFRLTAQPRYKVISYIENNGEYLPLEDVSEQLIAANATIISLQDELDATQDELATASESITTGLTARTAIETDVAAILTRLSGIEADEIVDDATDTTLLTAFAALVARVETLENA